MLDATSLEGYKGLVGFASRHSTDADPVDHIMDVYWACKGKCDQTVEARFNAQGLSVGWEDISDLVIPAWILRWVFAVFNRVHIGYDRYEDKAYEKLQTLMIALGQKVFRELTEEERDRFEELLRIPIL
jgi:hypothetical protein